MSDDTIDAFQTTIRSSLYRTMVAGLGGDWSSAGFKYKENVMRQRGGADGEGGVEENWQQVTNIEVMQTFFLMLIIFVQIVALNGLIAILNESYQKVNNEKAARVNRELAKMMVEYMDTWNFLPEPLAQPARTCIFGPLTECFRFCFPPRKETDPRKNKKGKQNDSKAPTGCMKLRCTKVCKRVANVFFVRPFQCLCAGTIWIARHFDVIHIFDSLEDMETNSCWVHKLELCSQRASRKFIQDLEDTDSHKNAKQHIETQRGIDRIKDVLKVMQDAQAKMQEDIAKLQREKERKKDGHERLMER